jgi:hypothetical protein
MRFIRKSREDLSQTCATYSHGKGPGKPTQPAWEATAQSSAPPFPPPEAGSAITATAAAVAGRA